jgi:hypothetical protein
MIVEGVIQSIPNEGSRLPDLPGKVECDGNPITLSLAEACARDVCPNPFATTFLIKIDLHM